MEEKSWQGRGPQQEKQNVNAMFLSTVFPKAKCEGSAVRRCYEDCQGQALEPLMFRTEPGPTGLGGCSAPTTKMKATSPPIKPKRDVFVTPKSIIKT